MDLEACVEPKFCRGDDDGNLHVKGLTSDVMDPIFCHDFKSKDDDHVLLPTMISSTASLGTCNNKMDMSIKRKFDNSNSLCIKVKKSKVSTYVDHDKDEHDIHLSDEIVKPCKSADNSFSSLKRDLALLEKLFEEGIRKTRVEGKRLQSIKREIEECCKELQNKKKKVCLFRRIEEACSKMQGKIEECIKDFVVKEGQLYLTEDLIGERTQELKTKETELNLVKGNISKEIELRQVIDKIDKDRGRKEDELKALSQKIAECTLELKVKEKELDAMNKSIAEQTKEFKSMTKQFEVEVKELKSKEKQYQGQVEELESNKKHFEGRVKDLETREKQLEGWAMKLESKEMQVEGWVKVLESIDNQLAGQVKEFETKEKEFECQMRELVSKQKHLESRLEELESNEKHLEIRFKELHSKENILVGRVKEFESKKKEFELPLEQLVKELESKQKYIKGRIKVLESIEQLEGRVRELESKERELEDHVKDIKLKEGELDGRVKEFESNKKHFESQFQNFKSKEKQSEGLESEMKKIDRQLKEPELTEKQYEVLTKYIVEEKDSGLQLDKCEKTDPGKLVLDIILNPTIPLSDKKGENATVIINDSCIYLLEQLMRISPNIKPCVRQEALKLALDLKANMKENTENSLWVLGFLLLLEIYGLVTSFIEDEILELFAFVANYKIATELFRKLGFANKVSDFVENLIKKQQFIGAVRFSCEYNLADKNQLVDLLQEHVRNAKQICESSCNNNSIEIKDKARDQEIAFLETVLECISDHRLEPKDLFNKEIKCRILELKGHQGS